MKKYLLTLFVIPVLFLVSQTVLAQTGVIVTSPTGGSFPAGSILTVRWTEDIADPYPQAPVYIRIVTPTDPTPLAQFSSTHDGQQDIEIPEAILPGDYKINVLIFGQNSTNFGDSNVFQVTSAPAPTVTSPRAGDNWAKGSTQTVSWDGDYSYWPQEIVAVSVRLEPSGVLLISRAPPPANKQFEVSIPATMSTGSVLIKVLFHSLSRTFEISSQTFNITADTAPAASITITTPKADGTTVWQANVANTITWQIDGGSFAADHLVAINRYAVSDPSTSLGSAFPLVNNLSYPVPANVLDPDNDPYFYTLTIGGVDARSGNFTVVDADDGNGGNPNFIIDLPGWKPPTQTPPNCDDPTVPGCWPPINVSAKNQIKSTGDGSDDSYLGGLAIGPLLVDAGAVIRGVLKLPSLVAGSGQFLTTNSVGQVILGTPGSSIPSNLPTCSSGQVLKWTTSWGCGTDDTGGGGPTDPNVWQKRVSSTCAEGSSIRVIDVNGGVTCEEDTANTSTTGGTVTKVTAGAGLSAYTTGAPGGEITVSGTIKIKNCDTAGQVLKWDNVNKDWDCDTDNTSAGGGEANTASNLGDGLGVFQQKSGVDLQFNSIGTYDGSGISVTKLNQKIRIGIPDSGVTTAKIADGAVTGSKIANDAVTTAKIANGTILPEDLALPAGLYQSSEFTTSGKIGTGDYKFCALKRVSLGLSSEKCEVSWNGTEWRMIITGTVVCEAICF